MNKKDLLQQCTNLFEQLQKAKAENERLTDEIKKYESDIFRLNSHINILMNEVMYAEKREEAAKKKEDNYLISEDLEYGAKIIGKIVVLATTHSNTLTTDGSTEHRDLVNLILGHTEVQKGKILDICLSSISFEDKKSKMDECLIEAQQYFDCVMEQRAEIEDESL